MSNSLCVRQFSPKKGRQKSAFETQNQLEKSENGATNPQQLQGKNSLLLQLLPEPGDYTSAVFSLGLGIAPFAGFLRVSVVRHLRGGIKRGGESWGQWGIHGGSVRVFWGSEMRAAFFLDQPFALNISA